MRSNKHEVNRLVNYARKASPEELMDDYGVELIEGGKVYDTIDDREYASLVDWAESITAQDEEDVPQYESRGRWDDEY